MRSALAISIALLTLAAASPAAAQVAVGIGEPSPDLFEDPRFRATGIRHARLIVPYDVVRARGWPLDMAEVWLDRARRDGIEPLVSFGHSLRRKRQFRLPSVREYAARVAEFRARYPWVREFSTWNEANHPGVQPTGRHPRRTAAFYRALKKQCEGCTVVAVEVLLTRSWRSWRWIRRFRERAGRGPHIFGLHNYPDVMRERSLNTRIFLRRVPHAQVWLTETGGVVRFRNWRHDETRAARAVRHVFRMASALPRVKRIYLYNWRADDNARWDSGLISRDGKERHGYWEFLAGLKQDPFRPPTSAPASELGPITGPTAITPGGFGPPEPAPDPPGAPD